MTEIDGEDAQGHDADRHQRDAEHRSRQMRGWSASPPRCSAPPRAPRRTWRSDWACAYRCRSVCPQRRRRGRVVGGEEAGRPIAGDRRGRGEVADHFQVATNRSRRRCHRSSTTVWGSPALRRAEAAARQRGRTARPGTRAVHVTRRACSRPARSRQDRRRSALPAADAPTSTDQRRARHRSQQAATSWLRCRIDRGLHRAAANEFPAPPPPPKPKSA